MQEPRRRWHKEAHGFVRENAGFHALVIIGLGIAVYSNTFYSDFHFDDLPNIVNNPAIRSLAGIPQMFTDITGPLASRPLALASFAFNYSLGGLSTFGFHVVNTALHILNGLLLYRLVVETARLSGGAISDRRDIAFFSALLFVSHPVQTEAVTYIVSRSVLLAAAFYLTGLLLVARMASAGGRPQTYVLLLFLVGLLGIASREDFVTFPIMLLAYDHLFIRRDKTSGVAGKTALYAAIALPMAYLVYLICSFDYKGAGFELESGVGPGAYFITQTRVFWTYIRLLFLPVNQNLDYDYPLAGPLFSFPAMPALLCCLGLWVFVIYLFFGRRSVLAFPLLWFLVTLLPSSSVLPLLDVIFEHRLYLPSAAFSVTLATALVLWTERWGERLGAAEVLPSLIVVVTVVVLAAAAYSRNAIWHDEVTLWEDTVKKSPNKSRGYNNLAMEYKALGRKDEAINLLQTGLRKNPSYILAHNNLAALYIEEGHPEKAIELLSVTLRLQPTSVEAHRNMGNALMALRRCEEAAWEFTSALRLNPGYAFLYRDLGAAYLCMGRYEEASRKLQTFLKLRPYDENGWRYLAQASKALGDSEKATLFSRIAARLRPWHLGGLN